MQLVLPFLLSVSTLSASTVLITGANRGLGLEFAKQLTAKGHKVIGTVRNLNEAKQLKELGVRVETMDIQDPLSIERLEKSLNGLAIDILINNAGIFRGAHDDFEEISFEEMALSFLVNSIGPMSVTQQLLDNLRAGKKKHVINISSQLASIERNNGGMYGYRASKAALNQLSKTLSIELAAEGFTCIALDPGWVSTDMGGPEATYTPKESISKILQVLDKLSPSDNGRYLDLHGNDVPW